MGIIGIIGRKTGSGESKETGKKKEKKRREKRRRK